MLYVYLYLPCINLTLLISLRTSPSSVYSLRLKGSWRFCLDLPKTSLEPLFSHLAQCGLNQLLLLSNSTCSQVEPHK